MSTTENSPKLDRAAILAQVDANIRKSSYSKEDAARDRTLLDLADRLDPQAIATEKLWMRARWHKLAGEVGIRRPAFDQTEAGENFRTYLRSELRDMNVGNSTEGGAFVPASFSERLGVMLKATDRLFDPTVATFVESDKGSPYGYPELDDTSAAASIVTENALSDALDPTIDGLVLDAAPTWRTGMVKLSMEMVQDSFFPIDNVLADAFAVRFRRGVGANFVSTLLSQASSSGQTVIGDDSASSPDPTSEVGYTDLLNLMDSVDPEYQGPGAGWLMSFQTLTGLRNLRDKQNHPMIRAERDSDGNPLLFDKPVFICPNMPSIASGHKCIAYGDVSKWIVRIVKNSLRVRRYNERFALYGKVAFEGFWRLNAGLLKAATADSPIKYLQIA